MVDILLMILTVEFLCLLLYFLKAETYFLYSLIVLVIYSVKYFDGDEFTGFRSWAWFRRFTLFGKSTQVYYGNPSAFNPTELKERMLFIVIGNLSNMGLIHGFGMHGGTFAPQLDLVYMLPWIMFKIPLLRDLLMWSGAVSTGRTDVEGNILALLKKGKSVAYCPSNMEDFVNFSNPRSDDPEKVVARVPSNAIFEFAIRWKIAVVPVLITNESLRYRFMRSSLMYRVHRWTYHQIGWPFPFFFYPRSPDKLNVQLGCPMDSVAQESAESFSRLFMSQFSGMTEVGGDSREVLIV